MYLFSLAPTQISEHTRCLLRACRRNSTFQQPRRQLHSHGFKQTFRNHHFHSPRREYMWGMNHSVHRFVPKFCCMVSSMSQHHSMGWTTCSVDPHVFNRKFSKKSDARLFCHAQSSCQYTFSESDLHASRLGLDPSVNCFHAPIVYHEHYSFADWPSTHTFPMDKFERLAHAVLTTPVNILPATGTEILSQQRPLVTHHEHFFRPLDVVHIPENWIIAPSGPIDPEFYHRFVNAELTVEEMRYIGFREQTTRPELIERTLLEVAGTILAAQLAWRYGISSNLAGGTHHAHALMGAGYTILNDLAITARFMITRENVKRILVVDCDVHQGDGTAKFGSMKGSFFTLSLHCASNYPQLKANSTFDVGLRDGIRDDEYMEILQDSVSRALSNVNPEMVFYDAGVDIYEYDRLGRLNITEDGIRRRDRWVLETCINRGIPVVAVIGGGYDQDVDALARRHAIVHEECAHIWRKYRIWERVPFRKTVQI